MVPTSPRAAQDAVRPSLPIVGKAPSFVGATGWLNSAPLTPADLRGKVVLVNIWNYTCINWLRSFPYVRAWAEKYKDQGLAVIGAHSPEFDFEKILGNVQQAVKDLNVAYPIAIDSDHSIWRAFNNQYWPALYFIDPEWRVRHRQYGEGEYDKSETVIQALLAEAGSRDVGHGLVSVDAAGVEAAADWRDLDSPETYLGYDRAENFASPGGAVFDARRRYSAPTRLALNHWALTGEWTVKGQPAALNEANGRIAYRFHARDLHLVLASPGGGRRVRFRVKLDGETPGPDHGADVDPDGWGSVEESRLYQLVRQDRSIADRTFEIEFFESGVSAYAFTFG